MQKKTLSVFEWHMLYYLYSHNQLFYRKMIWKKFSSSHRIHKACQHRYTASDRRQQRVSRPYPLLPDWSNAHICPYHFAHYICRCLHPQVLIGRFSRHLHQPSNLYKSSESTHVCGYKIILHISICEVLYIFQHLNYA